jgi:Fic family protein
MSSFSPSYLQGLTFGSDQIAAIQRLGEAKGRQDLFVAQAPEQLEILREAATIESSESSNRIEGVTAPPKRVAALVLKTTQPRNRSEQEIAGYRDALALIHESHEHMSFTPNVLLQLHSMLFRYVPSEGGHWKEADNEIIERGSDGKVLRVRFKPTSAVATPQAIEDLTTGYRRVTVDINPLIALPLSILDFLCIHPFRDGNGRMARLITLLLLYHSNYRVGRYISLERIVEESKQTYYETLEQSSQGWHKGRHDAIPWLMYFWGILIRAYSEFEERVGIILSKHGSKSELVRQAVNRRISSFTISNIEKDCPGVSRDMVRLVLRQMREEGQVKNLNRGRGAKWVRIDTPKNHSAPPSKKKSKSRT